MVLIILKIYIESLDSSFNLELCSIFPSLPCQICQKLFVQKLARNKIKKIRFGSEIKLIYWIQKV